MTFDSEDACILSQIQGREWRVLREAITQGVVTIKQLKPVVEALIKEDNEQVVDQDAARENG